VLEAVGDASDDQRGGAIKVGQGSFAVAVDDVS
jgi:hypothetical protein